MAIRRFVIDNPDNFTIEIEGEARDFYGKVGGISIDEPSNGHEMTYLIPDFITMCLEIDLHYIDHWRTFEYLRYLNIFVWNVKSPLLISVGKLANFQRVPYKYNALWQNSWLRIFN